MARSFPRPRAVLLLLTCAALAACGGSGAPIVLGAAEPLQELNGRLNRMGIDLAVAEINAAGGIHGRPLEVRHEDDEANGVKAAAIAQTFLDDRDVAAVVGHMNSGAMMAAAKIYDRGLPAVGTSPTSPDLSGISPWVFRVVPSDAANALAMARFAQTRLGARRAAVLYENDAYGRGLADSFRKAFSGQIVSIDPVAHGEKDFEPFVAWFRQETPDIVFVASTDVAGRAFLAEARRQRLDARILVGDGWTALAADTALAEGIFVGAPFTALDQRPEVRRFVDAFTQRFHVLPDGHAALAYDATLLLARVIADVGPDRAAIRERLATLGRHGGFAGVTGHIAFDAKGDPVGKEVVMTRAHAGALAAIGGSGPVALAGEEARR